MNKKPSFLASASIIAFMLIAMGSAVLVFDASLHVTMIIVMSFGIGVLLLSGSKWSEITEWLEYGGKIAVAPVITLYVIGLVISSWIASGTVPYIIYWGLKLINPAWFLSTSFLVCSMTSLATGSSWSTAGTVGIALMGVGMGMGISPAMTVGAICSGSYLGDKMSPLSDTTNLAPAIAEGDIFDHIKSMMYTTIPAAVICLVAYTALGMGHAASSVDSEAIKLIISTMESEFNLSIITLLPAVLVLFLAMKKKPALPILIGSILAASLLAIFLQGESPVGILKILDSGFASSTGIADIDRLLARGGFNSQHFTASLGMLGIAFGGVLEKSGVLEVFLSKFDKVTATTGGLVAATISSLIIFNFATGSQFLAIVLGGRMFVKKFKERNFLPQTFSRLIEDGGTVTSPLVPWGLCGIFFYNTLGVPTVEYAVYAIFCYAVPIISVIYGFTNKFMWKTGDIVSSRTYDNTNT